MSKRLGIFWLVCIMFFASLNFIFVANEKEGLHCDEVYSFGLSNYEEDFYFKTHDDWGNIKQNKASDIDKYLMADDMHRFEYDRVIYNQKSDVHPPLYYILIHTISSIFPGSFSYLTGIIPNIVFTLGTLIILYLTAMLIFKDASLSLLSVIFFAFGANCINMVIFIRMYAMLTFFTTAVLYLHLRLLNGDEGLNTKTALLLLCTTLFGALTHYYFLVFLFALALFCTIAFFCKKEYKKLLIYIMLMSAAGVIYLILWKPALYHIFFSSRGIEAFDSHSLFKNIINYLFALSFSLTYPVTTLVISALVIYAGKLLNKKTQPNFYISMLVFVFIIYFLIIAKISPYQADRYISPLFPPLSVAGVYLIHISMFQNKKVAMYMLIISVLVLGTKFTFYNHKAVENNYLYRISLKDKAILSESENRHCIYIYTHEAQFLLNFPDYRAFKSVSFVPLWDIDKIKKTSEDEVIVYINKTLDSKTIINTLCNNLGFSDCTLLARSDYRHQSDIYRLHTKM